MNAADRVQDVIRSGIAERQALKEMIVQLRRQRDDAWLAVEENGVGWDKALAERDAALAAITRVKAMHQPFSLLDGQKLCEACEDKYSYPLDWPCPTIQALGDQR